MIDPEDFDRDGLGEPAAVELTDEYVEAVAEQEGLVDSLADRDGPFNAASTMSGLGAYSADAARVRSMYEAQRAERLLSFRADVYESFSRNLVALTPQQIEAVKRVLRELTE